MDVMVASLHLQVGEHVLTVVTPMDKTAVNNIQVERMLEIVPAGYSIALLGDSHGQCQQDLEGCDWKEQPSQRVFSYWYSVLVIVRSLSIMIIMFSHKSVNQCTWHKDILNQIKSNQILFV